MIDLGLVAIMPWTDLYPLYDSKPSNFAGLGGYKLASKNCYVLMNGNYTGNIQLPVPSKPFDLMVEKNNVQVTINNFNGVIPLTGNGKIKFMVAYSIK